MVRGNKREIGTAYEKQAVLFLQRQGYDIVQTNFRCRCGEIDIIAKDREYFVFVEVKYRSDIQSGSPLEAVDNRKQRKIIQTAKFYLYSHGLGEETPCRFDVVGICQNKIILIRNAFEVQ